MKSKGSNLVEYTMGAVLVAVVFGLAVNSMQKDNTLANLASNSLNMTVDNKVASLKYGNYTDTSSAKVMDDPTSSLKPVAEACNSSGECTINFGDYSLKGIPDDFANLVETSGISGGTAKLNDLILQLAEQSKDIESPEASEKINKLANFIFNISIFEDQLENKLNTCTIGHSCFLAGTHMDKTADFNSGYGDVGGCDNLEDFVKMLKDHDNDFNDPDFTDRGFEGYINYLIDDIEATGLKDQLTFDIIKMLSGETVTLGKSLAASADNFPSLPGTEAIQENAASKISDVDAKVICYAGKSSVERKTCD